MRENGLVVLGTVQENKPGLTVHHIKVTGIWVMHLVGDSSSILLVIDMKDSLD